ncbi:MAG: response regulator transcription factor [Anaerolineales bacterium]|nr:response regulator transcription factor [Anaerolineales bacterium]MCB8960588.1 response regulator transcription factor [Ardenticatenales bacterium]
MSEPARILVVDDHPIVREGISSLLSNYPEFAIVGEAADGVTALMMFREQRPDITLLDIRMPGITGLDLLAQIRQIEPEATVIMLTSFDDDEYVVQALKAGALGYVLKSASDEMLVKAIRAARQGERILSPQVTDVVVRQLLANRPVETPALDLDADEKLILRLLCDGASNADIAGVLYLSSTSVKRKLRQIFQKMAVTTRAQAAAEAVRQGIV